MLVLLSMLVASVVVTDPGELSPEGAQASCTKLVQADYRRTGDEFLDLLLRGQAGSVESMVMAFGQASDRPAAARAAIALGRRDLLEALWPELAVPLAASPHSDTTEWDSLAGAVMCSNDEAVDFLLDQGADPNMHRGPEVADMMQTAISNKDMEIARLLFEGGYSNCGRLTSRGESLPDLADRLGMTGYRPLHIQYCGSAP